MRLPQYRARCVVVVRGPSGSVTIGPFSSAHMADDYAARLRRLAVRHGRATRIHTDVIMLDAPVLVLSVLRDVGVIDGDGGVIDDG